MLTGDGQGTQHAPALVRYGSTLLLSDTDYDKSNNILAVVVWKCTVVHFKSLLRNDELTTYIINQRPYEYDVKTYDVEINNFPPTIHISGQKEYTPGTYGEKNSVVF